MWAWDISWLPSVVRGCRYYLYLIEDVYSRKITGYEVHETESGEQAAAMKSQTLQVKRAEPGITPSHSRPRVSHDNAYVESLFRTLKYVPQWLSSGFKTLDESRVWVEKFIRWYNTEHRHSGIGYVTPEQRHSGEDRAQLKQREALYHEARERHPERWSRGTRNWQWQAEVTLNPEREKQAA